MDDYFSNVISFLLKNDFYLNSQFSIENIDNPGWYVGLDLAGSNTLVIKDSLVSVDNGDDDWIVCKCKDKRFDCVGDSKKLSNIFFYICNLLKINSFSFSQENFDIWKWMEGWYIRRCREIILTIFDQYTAFFIKKEGGSDIWNVKIYLSETKLSDIQFNYCADNFSCHSDGLFFLGKAKVDSLYDLLKYFKNWAEENGCS